jgi:hypothetical protein
LAFDFRQVRLASDDDLYEALMAISYQLLSVVKHNVLLLRRRSNSMLMIFHLLMMIDSTRLVSPRVSNTDVSIGGITEIVMMNKIISNPGLACDVGIHIQCKVNSGMTFFSLGSPPK